MLNLNVLSSTTLFIHSLGHISYMCFRQMSIPLYEHFTQVADTEVDCRAEMLIYLVENKLIIFGQ